MTHQTLHVIVSTHWFVFLASGWPVSHRKLITSLCSSAIYICRKAFVMSAMNAMGCNLKLTTMLRSGFRSSEQSLRDGQPFSCAEASKMTLSLVVAFSFLSQHGEVSSTGCYDFLPQMWTLLDKLINPGVSDLRTMVRHTWITGRKGAGLSSRSSGAVHKAHLSGSYYRDGVHVIPTCKLMTLQMFYCVVLS